MGVIRRRPIAHPEWLKACHVESTFALYREKGFPDSISAFLLVTPMKHALRAIYGCSNFGVAVHLLWEAVSDKIFLWRFNILYSLGFYKDEELEEL
jgi:hypothetical protein